MRYLILIFSFLTCITAFSQAPVVHYPFDGNGNDASGNGHHATAVTAVPTSDRFGNPSSAYYFNGINQVINLPIHNALKPGLPFTVSLWARFSSLDQYKAAIFTNEHRENRYSGYWIGLNSSRVHISYGDGGDPGPHSRRTARSNTPISINTWYKIVAVVRGPGDMELYVTPFDESNPECVDVSSTWIYQGSGGGIHYFGNSYRGVFGLTDASDTPGVPIKRFQGSIDDFKMWDIALTIEQIEADCPMLECEVESNYSVARDFCTMNFSDLSTSEHSNIIAWSWDFGDPASGTNNTSTLQNPTHTFSSPGGYTVCLTTTAELEGETCTDQICRTQACVDECSRAEFIVNRILESLEPVDVVNSCGLYQVVIDFPWPIIFNISIDWGDGTVEPLGFGANTHQYPDDVTASYDITVTITLADGTVCHSATETVLADCGSCKCDLRPTISYLSAGEVLGCSVNLFGTINSDPCYSDIIFTWSINGVQVSQGPEPFYNHTFDDSGEYQICLVVSAIVDGELCQDEVCILETVDCNPCTDDCDIIPVIEIEQVQNTDGKCLYSLSGENQGSICPSQMYSWFIYDAIGVLVAELEGQTALFSAPESGEYNVCLRISVFDDQCEVECAEEVCEILVANCAACPCKLSPSFDMTVDPNNCTLSLLGNAGPNTCLSDVQFFWYIDNELVHSSTNPQFNYEYSESGLLEVCLKVEANNTVVKCEAKICQDVQVSCTECEFRPQINIEQIDRCTYQVYGISGTSEDVIYEWNVYEAQTTQLVGQYTGQEVAITFPGNGNYIICLEVFILDKYGVKKCSVTVCKEIRVQDCYRCRNECDLDPKIDVREREACLLDLIGSNSGATCHTQIYLWSIYDTETGELITSHVGQNYTFAGEDGREYKICLLIFVLDEKGGTKCKKEVCIIVRTRCFSQEKRNPLESNLSGFQSMAPVSVFPNPTSGLITFMVSQSEIEKWEGGQLEITDQFGSSILRKSILTKDDLKVDLSSTATGVLFYKIMDNDNIIHSGKFIISK